MNAVAMTAQAEFAAALLDPARPCPDGLVAWNGSDAAVRFAVHRNNVVSSLVDALADTVPVVRELVGDEFFRAMAALFVRASPPRSRRLVDYGDALPEFIERFEPARSVPYLADMARLELARVRAYHAADADPAPESMLRQALAAGEQGGELLLRLHPSVAVLSSRHAVASIWSAHQGPGELSAIDPDTPETALVLRDGLQVLTLRVVHCASAFVGALRSGPSLAEAARAAADADAGFDLVAMLSLLLAHGAITHADSPGRLR